MSVQGTILLGVISGVLTSLVCFVFIQLFQKVILPWYKDLVYDGIQITGEWYAKVNSQEYLLEVDQNSNKIVGNATFTMDQKKIESGSKTEKLRTFKISGKISDRFILLNLDHRDRKRIGLVSILLEVTGDGTKLKGELTGYSVNTEKISSLSVVFYRDPKLINQQENTVASTKKEERAFG